MRRHSVPPPVRSQASHEYAHQREHAPGPDSAILAEAQALSARLAALNELTVAMQFHIDTDMVSMLQGMMQQAQWVLDFEACTVVLHQNGRYQAFAMREGTFREYAPNEFALQYGPLESQIRLIPQRSTTENGSAGRQSSLNIPLYTAEQHIGTVHFYATSGQHYSQDDLRIGMALALQVAAIIRNGRMLQAMERARDELGAILETIRDGVLVLSTNGRIMVCNQTMQRLLEVPAADLTGQRFMQVFRASGVQQSGQLDRIALRELWRTIRDNGVNNPYDTVSTTLRLANGRTLEWASVPLVENGKVMSYVLTWRDISTKVAMAQMQSDLTHMLVHDLRSPLTSMLIGLDILQNSEYDDQLWPDTFDYMRQGATIMLEQINTMLDVNKLEGGYNPLSLALCDIPELIETAVVPLQTLAQANQQQIMQRCINPLPSLICDVSMIRRVLQNLIDNALKFAPLGSEVVVQACLDMEHNEVVFSIQDKGPGVPVAYRQLIFEKFGQVKQVEHRRGTGLGLTFCRLAVEAHQGQIGVRDGEAGGSEFWFTLPLIDTF